MNDKEWYVAMCMGVHCFSNAAVGVDLGGGRHLREHFIEPHQRTIDMHLNPAGRISDVLPVVLGPPALHKAHANGAHACQLKDGLKALVPVDRLLKELSKLLVVEDLDAAGWRNLAHSGRVEAVRVVAVATLNEDGSFTEALGKHLPSHIEQVHTFANVPADVLNSGVVVDIGEEPQTEVVGVHAGISVAVHDHLGTGGTKLLSNALVELVVGDRAPVGGLLVFDLELISYSWLLGLMGNASLLLLVY